ncbi:hypothetical protein AVEN_108347-1 [Araneus ventricosus]|uniref:Uncharacterized protein n=1 Tax=Araneus ventricosus TaxID=182803 RepID=A0A4Y2CV25_ARAVE|nr:hypothetical protein AVEN_108347-1 [Araneus ventricosus]
MISENCDHSKGRVWTILNESGANPYRSTPVQGLPPRDAERRYTWCNFVMNNLEQRPWQTCYGRRRHVFRVMECLIDSLTDRWKIRDMLSKFDINYAGRLMFGAEFLMTGSLYQYFRREH